jgi:lysophospholipase L1-like esterase
MPLPPLSPKRSRAGLLAVAISLCSAALTLEAAPLNITIASDSTASVWSPNNSLKIVGWGQVLSNFFAPNIVVDDQAYSARSAKSFYDEGRWANCLKAHADFYFIQFGHNDGKPDTNRYTDPQTTFKSYLSNYVNEARASNGVPVLLTPPTIRNYAAEHTLATDYLQNYAQAMRELARL